MAAMATKATVSLDLAAGPRHHHRPSSAARPSARPAASAAVRGLRARGLRVVPLAAAAAPAVQAGAEEIVLQPIKEISGTVKLPGSKSLSNRILLLAALSEVSGDGPPSLPLFLANWNLGVAVWR